MNYIVGKYHEAWQANKWDDENGRKLYIDLMVNADIEVDDDNYDQFMKDLIGKTVEVEFLSTFISIAHGVKIVNVELK